MKDTPTADRVYLFPGVWGPESSLAAVRRALADAGVTAEVKTWVWPHPFDYFGNLMKFDANLASAAAVAAEISAHCRAHPHATVDLVGYSGGGGMAVLTAERLEPGLRVRNLVLVHPALSPTYDLGAALDRITGRIYHYHSKYDWFILGLGTQVFGSIDRENTPSAGKDGFVVEAAVPDPARRDRLRQTCWTAAMLTTGHFGGHHTIRVYEWNKRHVACHLLPPTASP